jgi:hypothetical protein
MGRLAASFSTPEIHPLDPVEQALTSQGWQFQRGCDDDLSAQFRGQWCDYSLHFTWAGDFNAVHFTCAFDARVPDKKRHEARDLLALANDRVWLGHFGIWEPEGLPMFRHAVLMRGAPPLTETQVRDLLDIAIAECERFYPAFQYVLWAGKSAEEALDAAMIEPVGEA